MKTKEALNSQRFGSQGIGSGRRVTRRSFVASGIKLAALGGIAPLVVPSRVLGGEEAPSNRITIGFIGCGEHGIGTNIKGFLKQPDAQLVAVCDVDAERREDAKNQIEKQYAEEMSKGSYKGCDAYNDFREIIDRKDIDAVCISTPDHWHVIPSIMAAKAGKDVICEKPLSLTISEGRALCDVVQKYKRVFQTASEQRGKTGFHRMCELVRNGRIGKLKHIEVGLPGGYAIKQAGTDQRPSLVFCDPPKDFDYEMWLGQTPLAPYCPGRCHWNFRWILDYSGGQFTDFSHHLVDIAQWGNNTEDTLPVEVEGQGEFPKEGLYNTATKYHCKYKYANGVTMDIISGSSYVRFEGDQGWIETRNWAKDLKAQPASILDSQIGANDIHLFRPPTSPSGGGPEHRNFLDCVKSRKKCYAHEEIGHRAVAIAHMGNIAMMLGCKLKFDPQKERFIDDDEANNKLSRPMREPWSLTNAIA